jgi:hypothetical protein
MAFTVTIAGVDKSSVVLLDSLKMQLGLSSTWTANFNVYDSSDAVGAYRPALDATVTITNGATTFFHGKIRRVQDGPIDSVNLGTMTQVTAMALADVVDQIVVDEVYAAGMTLEDVVTDLTTTYLAAYGITLDAGMATGATLEQVTFNQVSLRTALNLLQTITGWIWRITPADVLEFFDVGTKTAAYSLTAANNLAIGPVRWERTRAQQVNTVHLRYGTATVVNKTDTFTGTAAAGEVNFPLTYPALLNAGGEVISQGYVIEAGAYLPINGAVWSFDAANNRIVRVSDLGTGTVATFNYSVQFPLSVSVSDAVDVAANGVWAKSFTDDSIFDLTEATQKATGILRKGIAAPKIVTLTTRQGLELPGTTMTLTYTAKTLSGDHVIREVSISNDDAGALYTYQFLSGSDFVETDLDRMRAAITGEGVSEVGGTAIGSVVPNNSGRFDEDVVAHAGTAQAEVIMGTIGAETAYASGPGVLINRNPDTGGGRSSWAILADQDSGNKGLLIQDRSVAALGATTFTIVATSANDYDFRAQTGVTLRAGATSNRLGSVHTAKVELAGPETIVGGGVISAAQLTADTNDWNPSGLSTARIVRFTTDARRTITGLTATTAGHYVTLSNVGLNTAVFAHNSGSSSAANRIICPNEHICTLHAGDSLDAWYDTTASLWRINAPAAPSGPIRPTFAAGDFTASAGTWTVDSGDVSDYSYTVTDKLMTVWFSINDTDVSNAGVALRLAVPGGFTIATGANCQNLIRVSDAGATEVAGIAQATGGLTYLILYASLAAGGFSSTSSDNTDVTGQITFPIA